ncbi:MAG TPA: FtsX-like permease family protein, partial [Acidimicrobiales bacterium]|nr:FtsX-like permease family protein [Acidimicrobiales bacterium]
IGPRSSTTFGRIAEVFSGSLMVLLGAAVDSPLLVAPLAGTFGSLLQKVAGISGSMATRNALRNPRRTAGTAAALMIGLALISIVALIASSVQASAVRGVEGSVKADFVLLTPNVEPFTSDPVASLERLPQVSKVATASMGTLLLSGGLKHLYGIDPASWQALVNTKVLSGNLMKLQNGGFATSASVAEQYGWKTGKLVTLDLSQSGETQLVLRAIYADNFVDGDFLVSQSTFASGVLNQGVVFTLVRAAPGVSLSTARFAMNKVLSNTPQIQILDRAQFRSYINRDIDLLLAVMTALVIQAVAVALFGIVNSLSLSVFERTRELGLLRSIGASKRQLRVMIYWESLIVVSLGTVLGLAVGVLAGWASVRALEPLGVTYFSVPIWLLCIYLVAACACGIAASLWPAVRATRIDVLKAVAITG